MFLMPRVKLYDINRVLRLLKIDFSNIVLDNTRITCFFVFFGLPYLTKLSLGRNNYSLIYTYLDKGRTLQVSN